MPGSVQSVERAAAILRLLAGRRALVLSEVASTLNLAKGTTHGLLTTLKNVGFVEQDRASGRYRLTANLLATAGPGMDPNDLRSLSTNLADTLAARSRHAVRIGVLACDGSVEVVHHVFRPDNSHQVLEVGERVPAHATALGKVLLANAPAGPPTRPSPLVRHTHRTIVDGEDLRRTLAETRARGWASARDERAPGKSAIAAPLRTRGGLVVGAIGICGSTDRICGAAGDPLPALITLVQDSARRISRELGHTG